VFEKGFLQDVRHNLWEISLGWGRRSGLRQPNSGEIYRKVGRADCRNDFSNTLYAPKSFPQFAFPNCETLIQAKTERMQLAKNCILPVL